MVIFHNEERFLAEAIDSVLGQTCDSWELLLVDDGSSDGSAKIARTFADQHAERVRCLGHPGSRNLGMSASRNLGIHHARGEYIAFLDGDDVYRPPKLETQMAILDAHPAAAMVYGATEHWYSWTGLPPDENRDQFRRLGVEPDTLVAPPRLVSLFLRREAQTPGTCGILVRKSEILRVGGFEADFRGMFEDVVFLSKICLTSPVYVEGGRWDRYRQHADSHTRAMRRRGLYRARGPNRSYARYLHWLEQYAEDVGVDDPDFRGALRQELRPYRSALSYGIAATTYHLGRLVGRTARTAAKLGRLLRPSP